MRSNIVRILIRHLKIFLDSPKVSPKGENKLTISTEEKKYLGRSLIRSFLFDEVCNKPRGKVPTVLIKFFQQSIHRGAKWSFAPHLPLAFRYSFCFLLPIIAPRAIISACNNPSSLARRLISVACNPRQRQRRVIMHVPGTSSAFKQPFPHR